MLQCTFRGRQRLPSKGEHRGQNADDHHDHRKILIYSRPIPKKKVHQGCNSTLPQAPPIRCTATTSTDDNTSLTDADFRFAILDRIGLPPLPQIRRFLGTETCPFCPPQKSPSGAVPITSSHVPKCMGLAGRLNTHDKIVATLLHMCKDLQTAATRHNLQ
jgi:hypothetical protein